MEIDTRCSHEGGQDYKPLTLPEVRELLEMAVVAHASTDDTVAVRDVAKIQVRLGMAIQGMTCPHPINGPVAERKNAMDMLFVRTLQTKPAWLPERAEEIFALMSPNASLSGRVTAPTMSEPADPRYA